MESSTEERWAATARVGPQTPRSDVGQQSINDSAQTPGALAECAA
jgi:hypothetical protein